MAAVAALGLAQRVGSGSLCPPYRPSVRMDTGGGESAGPAPSPIPPSTIIAAPVMSSPIPAAASTALTPASPASQGFFFCCLILVNIYLTK